MYSVYIESYVYGILKVTLPLIRSQEVDISIPSMEIWIELGKNDISKKKMAAYVIFNNLFSYFNRKTNKHHL